MSRKAEDDFMAALLRRFDDSYPSSSSSSLAQTVRSPASPTPRAKPTAAKQPSRPCTSSDTSISNLIDLTEHLECRNNLEANAHVPKTPPRAKAAPADVDMDELFAGAEDWDLDDYVPSPKKPSPKKVARQPQVAQNGIGKEAYKPEPYTRCIVDDVSEVELEGRWSKQLDVRIDKQAKDLRVIYLQDDWYDTDVRPGDIVNAIGHFDSLTPHRKPIIKITAQTNLLILHPDILLTATALSNAPQCARKPLLSSLVRASNDITPALVWGNMLHEVMQDCLVEKRWDEAWINERIDEVLINGLGMLLALNVSVETARTELRRRAVGLGIFKDRYIADVPKPEAVLSDTRSRSNDSEMLLAIPQLHEIEEDIWSPKYGLKGKVDATVEAVIAEKPPTRNTVMNNYFSKATASSSTPTLTTGPRPFEIKTGRSLAGLEHRAQTMLYTLLTSERYGVDVPDGLLYYTQTDTVVRVPRSRNELRGLVVARNELAGYMIKRIGREGERRTGGDEREKKEEDQQDIEEIGVHAEPFLPRPIDSEHACRKCFTIDTCMLYRYAYSATAPQSRLPQLESPPSPGDSVYDTYQLKTGHLTPEQGMFFRQWETLLSLEERDLVRFRRELWTLGAEERERRGRCFAGMVLVNRSNLSLRDTGVFDDKDDKEDESVPPVTDGKVCKFSYTFVKSKAFASSAPPSSRLSDGSEPRNLLNGHLNVGDPVTLSAEPHLLAFAQGYITHLTPDEVRLGVDHEVDLGRIRARLQKDNSVGDYEEEEVIFRIDKDELFGGMGRMRNNLAQLFYVNGDTKRLELVVDLRKPVFTSDSPPSTSSSSPSSSEPSSATLDSPHAAHLNDSQKQAIKKVLTAEDYALILGMPGTGKTTVIAALIKILVDQGKTVLLTSYTHSAVDTILRKLSEDEEGDGGESEKNGLGFGVLRLGNVEKVHPDVRKYTLGARKKATSVEQLEMQWMSPPVVASTCLSVDHPLFNRRKFDFCIVDEASQITLPTCLGPLRYADKFILVGDHFQLPPLVKNPLARRGGLDVSLFRRLSDAYPESVIDLREQYRMNEDIMLLSNKLIYSDRLKCGSQEVAKRRLILPFAPSHGTGKDDWLDVVHRLRQKSRNRATTIPLCPGNRKREMCWLSHLASPDTTAVFVDTDSLGPGVARDSKVGDLVQNEVEAELVTQFVQALTEKWGVKKKDVGVISLYRQQVKLIKSVLSSGKRVQEGKGDGEDGEEVEVLTADKSQGRDKECIIFSMVRSNDEGKIGDLVKDWRRMNVSFTRARSKLVIFGSRKTLKGDALLGQFFELMEGRGWVYELPPDAHLVHRRDLDSRSQEAEEGGGDGALDEEEVDAPEQTFEEELTMCPEVHEEDVGADMDLTLVEMKPADVKDSALKSAAPVGSHDDDDVEVVDVLDPEPKPVDTKKNSSKAVAHGRGKNDNDEDVEIVDEFYTAPKSKSASSKARSESAKGKAKPAKKRKAEPMVIDMEEEVEEDDIMIVDSKPASSLAGKKKGVTSTKAEASSSVSATGADSSKTVSKSTSNGSLKRSRQGKENTSGKGSGGMGPLDKFFLVAKGSGTKTGSTTADDGSSKNERPKKKVKAEPPTSKKESTKPGTSTTRKAQQKDADRKASGLLKGRPILKDLVESEY